MPFKQKAMPVSTVSLIKRFFISATLFSVFIYALNVSAKMNRKPASLRVNSNIGVKLAP